LIMEENRDKGSRWEYRVTPDDTLFSLLERVRETPGTDLLLDITDNDLLRTDGALRRTLVSAASEFHKHLAFSFVEDHQMKKTEPIKKVVTTTVKKEKDRVSNGKPKNVPIAVISKPRDHHSNVALLLPQLGQSGKRVAIVFSFLSGLLITGIIFFLLPQADIKITPDVEPVNMDLKIKGSAGVSQTDAHNAIVPVKLSTIDEGVSGVFAVSHMDQQGDKAQGSVVIINKTGETQKIKGKSHLKAENGRMFTLDTAVIVPPKSSVKAAVTAEEGGEKGNLSEGKLYFTALSKDAEAILFAEVQSPLLGGTDKLVPSLDKSDIEKSSGELIKTEEDKLRKKIADEQGEGVIKDQRLVRIAIADPYTNEELKAPVNEFHLQGKARAEYMEISEKELFDLIRQLVLAKSGEGKVLGKPLSAEIAKVESVDWDNGEVNLAVHLDNIVHTDFDMPNLKKKLMGRTIEGVHDYLRAIPGVKDVFVKLGPFWIKRVPSLGRNIHIELILP